MPQTLTTYGANNSYVIKSVTDASFTLLTADFTTGVVTSSILPSWVCEEMTRRIQKVFSIVPVKADLENGFDGLVLSLVEAIMFENTGGFQAAVTYSAPTATYTLSGLTDPCHIGISFPLSSSPPFLGAGGGLPAVTYAVDESIVPTKTTTSAIFSTLFSTNYVQQAPNENLVIWAAGSIYGPINTSNTLFQLRLSFDSVASYVFPVFNNRVDTHFPYNFVWKLTGAATAGTKVVALEWAKPAGGGSGALTADSNDSVSLTIMRVQ